MKTTYLVGLVMAAAMNLVACPGMVPGFGGCAAADPDVDVNVAPLSFQPLSADATCDSDSDVTLSLQDAQGSSIRVVVKSDVRVGESLPLTASLTDGNRVVSSSADGAVQVTMTDAEYNELPGGWQSASVTIDDVPAIAGDSLSGVLHIFFADGRTLDVTLDNVLQSACPVPQTN